MLFIHRMAIAPLLLVASLSASGQTRGVSASQINVGTVQDLSGPLAPWGKDVLNGLRMRFQELNATSGVHGRKIRLFVEDSGYDPKRAVLAANKLVHQEGIFAMIQMMGSAPTLAAMPILMENKVLSFMPMTQAREMFDPLHHLKYGFGPPYFDGMKASTPRVYAATRPTKACAFYQDDEFGLEVYRGAEAGLKSIGVEFATKVTYKRAAIDFSSQVARLKENGCDFVVLGTLLRETAGTMIEMRKLDYKPVVIGSSAAYSELVPKLGGDAVEGLHADMFAQIPYADDASPSIRQWTERFKASFGTEPTIFAGYGYAAAQRFIVALEKAGPDLTPEAFTKAMDTLTIPSDLFGNPKLTFSPTKHIGSLASRVSRLENGRWKVIHDYSKE